MSFDILLQRDNLDGLPETVAITDLYEENDDGTFKFVPKIEGMKPASEVDKVTEALRKERDDHKKVRERFRDLGDRDVAEIVEKLDKYDEMEVELEAARNDKGSATQEQIEELVEKRLARLRAPLERDLGKVTEERDEAIKNNGALRQELDDLLIDAHMDVLTEKYCDPSVRRDVKEIARMYLVRNDEGEIVTRDELPLPALEWLQNKLQEREHWNKPTGNGNNGKTPGKRSGAKNNPFSAQNVDWAGVRPRWQAGALAAQDQLLRDEGRDAYNAAAKAAGVDPSRPGSFPPRPAT